MRTLEAINHLLNFFAPALVTAALSAAFAKLLWRVELRTVRWRRLAACGLAASAATLLAGLVVFGRDGKMATYGAMLLANAAALWWAGFGPARR